MKDYQKEMIMRKIEFEQGSNEWLKWRKGLLTATDAPMLMGVSPYVTPYKGWQRKLGLTPEQKSTPAMQRGQTDEPIARAWFNQNYGLEMEPCCIESDDNYFLGASLDGLSKCGKYILEVKSNNLEYHLDAALGLIPTFHMYQMFHQMLCTDGQVEKAFYLSWNDGKANVVEVVLNKDWVKDFMPQAQEFWKKVTFYEAPEMTNKDYIPMGGSEDWSTHASAYHYEDSIIKAAEKRKEFARSNLIRLAEERSCMGDGVKLTKKSSKGRIDYKEACEKLILDDQLLESYRKPAADSWIITLERK